MKHRYSVSPTVCFMSHDIWRRNMLGLAREPSASPCVVSSVFHTCSSGNTSSHTKLNHWFRRCFTDQTPTGPSAEAPPLPWCSLGAYFRINIDCITVNGERSHVWSCFSHAITWTCVVCQFKHNFPSLLWRIRLWKYVNIKTTHLNP